MCDIKDNFNQLSKQNLVKFLFLPIQQILLFVFLLHQASHTQDIQFKVLIFLLFFLTLYSVFFIVCKFPQILNTSKVKNSYVYLMEQKKIQRQHYEALVSQMQQSKEFVDQFSNTLEEIEVLLWKKDLQEIKVYLEKLSFSYENVFQLCPCKHPAINALVYNKLAYARAKQIKTEITLSLEDQVKVSTVDLVSLFSNLLDNAIESCLRGEEEEMFLQISDFFEMGLYTLKVRNSKRKGDTVLTGEKKTSKQNKLLHGYGLSIIEDLVKKYDGAVKYKDQGEIFEVTVFLRV